jgi:hypothetical protein
MLKMAMEQAGIAEPPITPIEATAGLAMLLLRRSAIGRRSAECSSTTPPGPGRHRWREPLAHQIQPRRGLGQTSPR